MKTNQSRAFTLSEVMISVALGGLVLAAVLSTFLLIARSARRVSNYSAMENEASRSLEVLAREIRMATSIKGTPVNTANLHLLSKISLNVPNEEKKSSSENDQIVADYLFRTEANGSISLIRQGKDEYGNTAPTRVLVRNIDPNRTHQFVRYDRAPGHAINDYSTNQIELAMTIQPNDRGIVAATSERVISAYFVLRNR